MLLDLGAWCCETVMSSVNGLGKTFLFLSFSLPHILPKSSHLTALDRMKRKKVHVPTSTPVDPPCPQHPQPLGALHDISADPRVVPRYQLSTVFYLVVR
jgi:hypothetical protein